MAGVFDLELESSNFEQEDVSDEDPIDIAEDQVQVYWFSWQLLLTTRLLRFSGRSHNVLHSCAVIGPYQYRSYTIIDIYVNTMIHDFM